MAVCCGIFVMSEIWHFKTRQGWGAITMYFGILAWFCHDYLTHWYDNGPWAQSYPEAMPTVGKMAFLHCLFVTFMAFGIALQVPDKAVRWINRYPEPRSYDFLFWLASVTLVINLGFYFFFSFAGASLQGLYETIYALYFGGRLGQVGTSVSMGGNLTTNFSGYLIMVAGTIGIGAHAAAGYLVFAPRNPAKKALMLATWLHAMMMSYGGGTRSILITQGASMGIFLLIYAIQKPRAAVKIYLMILGLCLVVAIGVQLQTHYRDKAYDINLSDQKLTSEIRGNTMFSEALSAYIEIPDRKPFFHNQNFPGEGAVRALPQMAFWFALGPVPRPLLAMFGIEKPIDPAWAYRAEDEAGTGAKNMGTTASYGLVGAWYFRFGILGMLEGAILMGWLYALAERIMRTATMGSTRIMRMIIGMSLLTTLLMFYRDVVFIAIWPIILTLAGIGALIYFYLPHQMDKK